MVGDSRFNHVWLSVGMLALLASAFLQTVTLASEQYETILTIAFVLAVVAVVCLLRALWRGGGMVRILCVTLLVPTLIAILTILLPRLQEAR